LLCPFGFFNGFLQTPFGRVFRFRVLLPPGGCLVGFAGSFPPSSVHQITASFFPLSFPPMTPPASMVGALPWSLMQGEWSSVLRIWCLSFYPCLRSAPRSFFFSLFSSLVLFPAALSGMEDVSFSPGPPFPLFVKGNTGPSLSGSCCLDLIGLIRSSVSCFSCRGFSFPFFFFKPRGPIQGLPLPLSELVAKRDSVLLGSPFYDFGIARSSFFVPSLLRTRGLVSSASRCDSIYPLL